MRKLTAEEKAKYLAERVQWHEELRKRGPTILLAAFETLFMVDGKIIEPLYANEYGPYSYRRSGVFENYVKLKAGKKFPL